MPGHDHSVIRGGGDPFEPWAPAQSTPRGTGWATEVIEDFRRVRQLEDEWRALWESVDDSTPFQSPDWLLPWWGEYGGERPLLFFAFRSRGQLVGVAPCYIFTDSNGERGAPVRRVFLFGTGNSDYLDVTFLPEYRSHCARALLEGLGKRSGSWDECVFPQLRGLSPLLSMKAQDGKTQEGLLIEKRAQEECPVLYLPRGELSDSADWMLRRTAHYRSKLERMGDFRICEATRESLDSIFDALVRLHSDRWKALKLPGVLSHPRDCRFHRAAASNFLRAGMLRLYGMSLGDRMIAALYGFSHGRETYYYLSGFDPELSRWSVGTVMVGHSIHDASRRGCERFCFLRGREPYKYRWGARDEEIWMLAIRKHSPEESE